MRFSNQAKKVLLNLPGWRTNRKIIVIESDDWGSIRMPSREVYKKCIKEGYPVDKNPFDKYDSILSEQDLDFLFNILIDIKDSYNNHPVITANCVIANPDFNKIIQNKYNSYHYEVITETFAKYPMHSRNFLLWQQGIDNKIFYPQFHGREHLNVSLFMNSLKNHNGDVIFALQNSMPGISSKGNQANGNYYVKATEYISEVDKKEKLSIIMDGLEIFETLFGYKSFSIIPTNYIWSPDYNQSVLNKGVFAFQGIRVMFEPNVRHNDRPKRHYFNMGERNNLGQVHLVRNVVFEPSIFTLGIKNPVERCLSDISVAFRMRKPAIICSHRINYVGYIDEGNRDRSLRMLKLLLKIALERWPDIEFMSSEQLSRVILEN